MNQLRPSILSGLPRLRSIEGLEAVFLLSFGGWLILRPPSPGSLPVWQAWSWAVPMIMIGIFQMAVLLSNSYRGRVWAAFFNMLIWLALTIGAMIAGAASFGLSFFVPFAVFAAWTFVVERFGAKL